MSSLRREFLARIAAGFALHNSFATASDTTKVRAVAFDGFAIFNPEPVFQRAETLFRGKGAELCHVWRTRQFEYMWLQTLSGTYGTFRDATRNALVFAANATGVEITSDAQAQLMDAYLNLSCWPEAPGALLSLKKAGLRLALLSNMTATMLSNAIRNSHLDGMFECVLSTDQVRASKPDARAYRMGTHALHLHRPQILFTASAGWDAAGAKMFGYPTYWVNRQDRPSEELGAMADAQGRTLDDLARYVRR